jgi:hypothetical protein
VEFYLPDEAEIVEQAAEIQQAKAGADWNCDHCNADNKAGVQFCISCGNERNQEDRTRQTKEYDTGAVPQRAADIPRAAPPRGASINRVAPTQPEAAGQAGKSQAGLPGQVSPQKPNRRAGLILSGIILLLGFLLWPHQTEVVVTGHSWERTIEIEKRVTSREEGWDVPAGGRVVETFKAIKTYNKVLERYEKKTRTVKVKSGTEKYVCGKKDLGNGYFDDKYCERNTYTERQETYDDPIYRKEPVYASKYRYDIDRWKRDHTDKASGNDKNPIWPKQTVSGPDWRDGPKKETYTLLLQTKSDSAHPVKVSQAYWSAKNKGDRLPAKTNYCGGVALSSDIPTEKGDGNVQPGK